MTDLASNGTYTVENGDTVKFQHGGEDATGVLIINERVVHVIYESGEIRLEEVSTGQHKTVLIFDTVNETKNASCSSRIPISDIPKHCPEYPFFWPVEVTLDSNEALYFELSFEFVDPLPGGTDGSYVMPQEMIDRITQYLVDRKSEDKLWGEFSYDHKWWEFCKCLAAWGMIKFEDIPDEPKIEDYDT